MYVHTLLCTIWAPERRPSSDLGWKCLSFFLFLIPTRRARSRKRFFMEISSSRWRRRSYSVQYVQNTCLHNITYCNLIRLGISHKLCTRPALGPVSNLETRGGRSGIQFDLCCGRNTQTNSYMYKCSNIYITLCIRYRFIHRVIRQKCPSRFFHFMMNLFKFRFLGYYKYIDIF